MSRTSRRRRRRTTCPDVAGPTWRASTSAASLSLVSRACARRSGRAAGSGGSRQRRRPVGAVAGRASHHDARHVPAAAAAKTLRRSRSDRRPACSRRGRGLVHPERLDRGDHALGTYRRRPVRAHVRAGEEAGVEAHAHRALRPWGPSSRGRGDRRSPASGQPAGLEQGSPPPTARRGGAGARPWSRKVWSGPRVSSTAAAVPVSLRVGRGSPCRSRPGDRCPVERGDHGDHVRPGRRPRSGPPRPGIPPAGPGAGRRIDDRVGRLGGRGGQPGGAARRPGPSGGSSPRSRSRRRGGRQDRQDQPDGSQNATPPAVASVTYSHISPQSTPRTGPLCARLSRPASRAARDDDDDAWREDVLEFDVLVEIPRVSATSTRSTTSPAGSAWTGPCSRRRSTRRLRLHREHLGLDGDPPDALVLLQEPTFPGCLIRCRAIGMFRMTDEAGGDDKVPCVPATDPAWSTCGHLPRVEVRPSGDQHFFEVYKGPRARQVGRGGAPSGWNCTEAGDRGQNSSASTGSRTTAAQTRASPADRRKQLRPGPGDRSISGGTPPGVDGGSARDRADLAAQGVDLAADRLGPWVP